MTRKDFELIADWVKQNTFFDDAGRRIIDGNGLQALANKLSTTNENFDKIRFLEACGAVINEIRS